MACASQAPTALLLVPYQCRVTHPWILNSAASKYYNYTLIRLAAGFQKRSAMPASYQMQSHMAILIAYRIDMKEDHQTWLNFAVIAGKWQKTYLLILCRL